MSPPVRSPLPLRVMTFNLRRRRSSDGPNRWSARRAAASHVLEKYAPDLVGTQEGLEDQIEDLEADLPGYGMVGEARFGGRSDEFNAILYRRDRFSVESYGNFWLSDTPDVPGSRTWGNIVPRMATWAWFVERERGDRLFMLNTHLDHLVPSARRRGAKLIESRLPRGDEPVILTGDFNSLPQGRVYRYFTNARHGGLADSLRLAEDGPERWNATFHSFTGRGLARIDYVFARARDRVLRHLVARDRVEGRFPSDHFPVLAEMALRVAS